jgi:hypothetical protein
MRTLSIKEVIGLFVFGLLGFLLYIFGIGLIHRAWNYLVVLYTSGTLPPDFFQIPFIQGNPAGLAVLHDLGIFLASIGIIVLYIVYFVWLLPLGNPERARRGFEYILGFLLVFAAWIGIWICMHRAFIFLAEAGTIGFFIQNPFILHSLGLILVGLFLLGTMSVVIYKVLRLLWAFDAISDTATHLPASQPSETIGFPIPFGHIRKDWKFYFLIFIPYFSAAFSVWILLFEGFIAELFGISIIWALIPWFVWTPGYYMLFGGALLFLSMFSLWTMIVFVRRAPLTGILQNTWWWQGTRRYLFVFLTIIVLVGFLGGFFVITWSYLNLSSLLVSTALVWQQIGEALVLLALVTAFIIIVGERASEA